MKSKRNPVAAVAFIISMFLAAFAGSSVLSDLLGFRFLPFWVFSVFWRFWVRDCSLELEYSVSILVVFCE